MTTAVAHRNLLTTQFMETCNRLADRNAINYAVHRSTDDPTYAASGPFAARFQQISYTFGEYRDQVIRFAKALIDRNIQPGRAITIQGGNAPQWLFAHMGAMFAGNFSAGVYPNNNPEASQHVARDSGAQVVVVENREQLEKYQGMESSDVRAFVVWGDLDVRGLDLPAPVYSWEEFCAFGNDVDDDELADRMAGLDSDSIATLIYTSGTTGLPKGVVLTHDNLMYASQAAGQEFGIGAEDRGLSYLPLSHIAAQQLDCVVPAVFGSAINIAAADALKGANLRDHVLNTRPTYFLAIPRVWEKFMEAIQTKLQTAPSYRRWIFHIASNCARRVAADRRGENEGGNFFMRALVKVRQLVDKGLFWICQKLVFGKIHEALGLDRCRVMASGAAPISPAVLDFFDGIGIRIIDVYGMSETSGPATVSTDPRLPRGSCGRAIEGSEVRIDSETGELLVRGRHLTPGYHGLPEKSAELFDEEGWLHTGDLASIDENGFVSITGRLKELIVTAGGENIPPVRIEQRIKEMIPIVSNAVVIGDGRRFLSVLLSLKTELDDNGQPTDRLAPEVRRTLSRLGVEAEYAWEVQENEALISHLQDEMRQVNRVADSRAQRIQKLIVMPEDLSVDNGLLTPTLKMKRPRIYERYATAIEELYSAE